MDKGICCTSDNLLQLHGLYIIFLSYNQGILLVSCKVHIRSSMFCQIMIFVSCVSKYKYCDYFVPLHANNALSSNFSVSTGTSFCHSPHTWLSRLFIYFPYPRSHVRISINQNYPIKQEFQSKEVNGWSFLQREVSIITRCTHVEIKAINIVLQ